jgi:DNA-binding MarR family transcriptional regulator
MDEEKEFTELIDVYYQSWFKINEIYHVWSRKHGIQDTTLFVLYVINESPTYCTQNHICDKLSLPKQTISLILSELEKKGYVLRELNPKDRRNKVVRFTEMGEQYANELLKKLKYSEIEALSTMSQKQRRDMVNNLSLLSDILEKSFSK